MLDIYCWFAHSLVGDQGRESFLGYDCFLVVLQLISVKAR